VEAEGVDAITVPMVWEICSVCRGNGQHSHGIGAITQEEWFRDWDEDERENYMNGFYDKPCEACQATGKVYVIDVDRFEVQHPELFKAYIEQCEEEAAYQRMCDAERRMGA
jgi:RecJ-like exonuclease